MNVKLIMKLEIEHMFSMGKMKKLFYIATFTLAISSFFMTEVAASGKPGDYRGSHLVKSVAIPNDAYGRTDTTHKISVHIQGTPLTELIINVPEGVKINRGIKIINESGKDIPATISMNQQTATISFSQPIQPETKLSIFMNGVKTISYNHIWQYKVYAQDVGFTQVIPLGIAQIQTYR